MLTFNRPRYLCNILDIDVFQITVISSFSVDKLSHSLKSFFFNFFHIVPLIFNINVISKTERSQILAKGEHWLVCAQLTAISDCRAASFFSLYFTASLCFFRLSWCFSNVSWRKGGTHTHTFSTARTNTLSQFLSREVQLQKQFIMSVERNWSTGVCSLQQPFCLQSFSYILCFLKLYFLVDSLNVFAEFLTHNWAQNDPHSSQFSLMTDTLQCCDPEASICLPHSWYECLSLLPSQGGKTMIVVSTIIFVPQ